MTSFPKFSLPKPCMHLYYPPYVLHARPSHSSRFNHRMHVILGREYRSLSYSLCSFLHFLVTSSLLGPNILLVILFSNTLSLRSSFDVKDQVSHPYKTHDKWVSVTTAWCVLRLWVEEPPPIRRLAANMLNKQSRTADKGWSSSLGLG